jgi:hypothetical protein
MGPQKFKFLRLSDRDLDFLIETVHPEVVDKVQLKRIIREDEEFRISFISDEKIFRRMIGDEEIFLKISPPLFFEILLRKVTNDLKGVSFTIEKTGTMKIPIFDTKDVVDFLKKKDLLDYLADMLSSFTRVESYTISFEARKGVWEKVRFNDLDIFSLMSLVDVVEEEYRIGFYKRIADICLFILGIFPDYAERKYRYPFSGQVRSQIGGRLRIGPKDYEKEGRRFYKLAAEHHAAREMELSEIFWTLHEDFQMAKKPLNFVAEHYLHYKRQKLFS